MTIENDKNNNGIDDSREFELEEKRWYARKEIAKRAFASALIIIFVLILLGVANPELVKGLEPVIDIILWGLAGLFSIVGTFMGVSTWYDVSKKR